MLYLNHSIAPFLFDIFSKDKNTFYDAYFLIFYLSLIEYSMDWHSTHTELLIRIPAVKLGFLSVLLYPKVRGTEVNLFIFNLMISYSTLLISLSGMKIDFLISL